MKRRPSRPTTTLWSAGEALDPAVAAFTTGDDRRWDGRLLTWDLLGSIAHADGLAAAGLLSRGEHRRLVGALRTALAEARAGRFRLTDRDEDVHTAVERRLTRALGTAGEKIHTGRSRNDQVLVDLRLHAKDRLLAIGDAALASADALRRFARRHPRVLWPGYTHQRRAMPSTVALWACGYAEGLLDDVRAILHALDALDRSPLGSAAGFGVPIALPRETIASSLGFAGIQRNVTSVQASRGKLEAMAMAALWGLGNTLGKLSWDVILFSSEEFGFLEIPASLATGSSIMPHKRNPDLFELTRAREGVLAGLLAQAIAVAGKLPGGYHRDLQMTKPPFMSALDTALEIASMTAVAIPRLGVNRRRCAAALDAGTLATDEVYRRVREGVPFREAYRKVASAVRRGEEPARPSEESVLGARARPGEAGDPGIAGVAQAIRDARRDVTRRRRAFDRAISRLEGTR